MTGVVWILLVAVLVAAGVAVVIVGRPRLKRQAQREADRRARLLAETAPVGLLQMDAAGMFTAVNTRFRELWHMPPGLPPASFDWYSGLHPDDRDRILSEWGAAMAAAEPYEAEFRILAPDGSWRWARTRAATERDAQGVVVGHVAVTEDIHDARLAASELAQSETLRQLTMANLPNTTVGLYDRELRLVLVEGTLVNSTLNTERCRGKRLEEFADGPVVDLLGPAMQAALGGERTLVEGLGLGGEVAWQFQVAPFQGEQGEIDGALVVVYDVTEQRRAQAAERQATEEFRLAFEHAPIGVAVLDLEGRPLHFNAAFHALTGHRAADLNGSPVFSMVHLDDLGDVLEAFHGLGVSDDSAAVEFRIVRADGGVIWVDARATLVRDGDGQPLHVLAQLLDLTKRRAHESQLQHMMEHDPLTGLLNRRGFEERLEE